MTMNSMNDMIDAMAARLEALDPATPEYRALLAQMDALAERLARETEQEIIDEAAEAMFDNMPV